MIEVRNPCTAQDLGLLHPHHHAFRHCSCCRQVLQLPDQAALHPKEFIDPQDSDNGFLALGNDRDFDLALLNIENCVSDITLRKDFFTAFGAWKRDPGRPPPETLKGVLQRISNDPVCTLAPTGCTLRQVQCV